MGGFIKYVRAAMVVGAISAFGLPTALTAAPMFINTGHDFNLDPDGSTTTTTFSSLGYAGTLNTDIWLGSPPTPGTTVVATNIPSIMNFYGFSAGIHTTLSGGTATFSYPNAPAQNNIDALNNPANLNLNGFTGGVGFPQYGAGAVGGLGGAWGLTYSYQLVGKTVDSGADGIADYVDYTGGVFSLFYQSATTDPNNGKEVARFIVTGSTPDTSVKGYVDYSYAAGDTFIQNFFNDAASGKSLYSQWLANNTSVPWSMDFDGSIATPSQLWNTGSSLMNQSAEDGSLSIGASAVPEPATLALFGIGLAGLGFARRKQ